ncbi:hypothetical protein S40288_10830 [Stachybotrys chartarum IBT 40288]|nr:hypothetical protein S40288_10830 [Stachybotrys chartarum IBT 40288]
MGQSTPALAAVKGPSTSSHSDQGTCRDSVKRPHPISTSTQQRAEPAQPRDAHPSHHPAARFSSPSPGLSLPCKAHTHSSAHDGLLPMLVCAAIPDHPSRGTGAQGNAATPFVSRPIPTGGRGMS